MSLTVSSSCRLIYFAERGSWDDVLQTFVNADGDATSFGQCRSFQQNFAMTDRSAGVSCFRV